MKDCLSFVQDSGLNPISLEVVDIYGNYGKMTHESQIQKKSRQEVCKIPSTDDVLYRKDKHLISDFA